MRNKEQNGYGCGFMALVSGLTFLLGYQMARSDFEPRKTSLETNPQGQQVYLVETNSRTYEFPYFLAGEQSELRFEESPLVEQAND